MEETQPSGTDPAPQKQALPTEARSMDKEIVLELQPAAPPEEPAAVQAPASPEPQFATIGIQAVPTYAVHEVNTITASVKHSDVSHTEAGWPAEVDPSDGEQVARWRKKVERDEDYIKTVLRLGAIVEDLVRQNNALDIYADYFAGAAVPSLEPPILSILAPLRHPHGAKHAVNALSWAPNRSGHLAAAFDGPDSGLCAIYDTANSTSVLTTLTAPSAAMCLAYNEREHSVLGAGLRNGRFALFDVRQGSDPIGLTDPHQSHTDCVTGLAWTQSRTGTEFMTTSLDGTVAWWDSRRLNERADSAVIRERSSGSDGPCLAATCLQYTAASGPAKFMVGAALGLVLAGNRRAKVPGDRISASFPGHVGAVRSLVRHPMFPKYFLSIGDWTARLWSEDLRSPLVATPSRPHYLTGGAWSPSRPSVFFCTTSSGSVEAWDLLQSHAEPVLSASVADCTLTSMAVHDAGEQSLIAVGCADGNALVLRPSVGLSRAQDGDKAAFIEMMELECEREKSLEKAGKEAKARKRKEATRAAEPVTRVTEADLDKMESEFLAMMAAQETS